MAEPTKQHPSYNHRPIPTFQLMAKVAKFNGQRKDALFVPPNPQVRSSRHFTL